MLFLYAISITGLLFLLVNNIFFFTNKTVRTSVSKVFLYYIATLFVIEVFCHIIGISQTNSNFYISHFYFFFQFTFLSYFFYTEILSKFFKKTIIAIYIIQILALAIMYYRTPDLFWQFNTFEIVSTSLLLIIYSVFFLFNKLELQHRYFNFSIGLILYLSCSIAIFLSGNLDLVLVEDPYIDIWIFNSLFYIVFQFFIFREYLFIKKQVSNLNRDEIS